MRVLTESDRASWLRGRLLGLPRLEAAQDQAALRDWSLIAEAAVLITASLIAM